MRYYITDDDTNSYWVLDGWSNRVELRGSYGVGQRPLTGPYTVDEIEDVTWSSRDHSWVTVTGQTGSYRLYASGNGPVYDNDRRFFEADDDLENFWEFNTANNTMSLRGNGRNFTQSLNGRPFNAADIKDVTWSGGGSSGGHSWFRLSDARSFRVSWDGSILNQAPVWYYEADEDLENYWVLNALNNTIELRGAYGMGSHTLQTNIFRVGDIQDVTWSRGGDAWVTVAPVPLPAAAWLFITAVSGLLVFSRRRVRTA